MVFCPALRLMPRRYARQSLVDSAIISPLSRDYEFYYCGQRRQVQRSLACVVLILFFG